MSVNATWFHVPAAECICSHCKMYLSKLKYVFLQIEICISPNWKMYFSKLTNVFVQINKCISPNWKMYLSKLKNVFVQIGICICQIEKAEYHNESVSECHCYSTLCPNCHLQLPPPQSPIVRPYSASLRTFWEVYRQSFCRGWKFKCLGSLFAKGGLGALPADQ